MQSWNQIKTVREEEDSDAESVCVMELSSRQNKVVLIRSFSGIIVRICCLEDD